MNVKELACSINNNMKKLTPIIFIATVLLSLPRFAHYTEDSPFYLLLSGYYLGSIPLESLVTPYAYRMLVPLLAAWGPTQSLAINFAIISLVCTLLSYYVFYLFLCDLFPVDRVSVSAGMLILVFSFPTVNYSSAVLTDAGGFLASIVVVYFLYRRDYKLFALTSAIGILIRETVLMVIMALMLERLFCFVKHRRLGNLLPIVYGLPAMVAYLAIRQYFRDLPVYIWIPSVETAILNFTRPVSWVTLLLTIFPPVALFIWGIAIKRGSLRNEIINSPYEMKSFFLSIAITGFLYVAYSITSAYMSGRFAWLLYPLVIPAAVYVCRDTIIFDDYFRPALRWLDRAKIIAYLP